MHTLLTKLLYRALPGNSFWRKGSFFPHASCQHKDHTLPARQRAISLVWMCASPMGAAGCHALGHAAKPLPCAPRGRGLYVGKGLMATQTQLCPSGDSAGAGRRQGVNDGFPWALDAVTSAGCDFVRCHRSELAASKSEYKPPLVPNLPASVNIKICCHSWKPLA